MISEASRRAGVVGCVVSRCDLTCSFSPYMTAVKASVVGSGPILIPGKSLSSKYLMKEVLPVEYCPTRRTIGLASKSGSLRAGDTNSWKS